MRNTKLKMQASLNPVENMFRSFLLFTLITAGSVAQAQIGTYNFTGVASPCTENLAVNSQPSGAVFSSFSRSNVTDSCSGTAFRSFNCNTGAGYDPAEYVYFSLDAASGYNLSFTTADMLQFKARVNADNGALDKIKVEYSLDGAAFVFMTEYDLDAVPMASQPLKVFSFPANITSVTGGIIEFRISVYSVLNSATLFIIDDAQLFGTINCTNLTYSSATTSQVLASWPQGSIDSPVIGIEVTTSGACGSLSLTGFDLATTGSTNPATDLSAAKIYYTGTSPYFSTTTLFGSVSSPNGAFSISGSQSLTTATTYYFWLAYDIKSGAGCGDLLDATCNVIYAGGANVPLVIAPPGVTDVLPTMTYQSSLVTQVNNAADVSPGSTGNLSIGIQVTTLSSCNPISASSFSFNTTGDAGSTNPSGDILNAKLWYTGTSGAFATTAQIGSQVISPNGYFKINGFSQVLAEGTNYFWLTYDAAPGATQGNKLDARCDTVIIAGSPKLPSTSNPTGSRSIGPVAGTYIVNSNNDVNDGTCNTAHCSFREAIRASNSDGISPSTILFDIPGASPHTITLTGDWYSCYGVVSEYISSSVIIDGTSQPGYSGVPIIEINANGYFSPLNITNTGCNPLSTDGTTIKALILNRNIGCGLYAQSGNNFLIDNCYIGTDATGTSDLSGTNTGGIFIAGTSNSTISNCVISGNNGTGIMGGNNNINLTIVGNKIGTNAAGTAAIPNSGYGIALGSASATSGFKIGGTSAASRNIISGNTLTGVFISGTNTGGSIKGNYIGTDVTGTAAIGNGGHGVHITSWTSFSDVTGHSVGGYGTGAANIIANNTGSGIAIERVAAHNCYQNLISRNLIYNNGSPTNKPIKLNLTAGQEGNSNYTKPTVTSVSSTSVSGTALISQVGDTIEVFASNGADVDCKNLHKFLGKTVVTAGGAWTLSGITGLNSGDEVKATVRNNTNNNTSECSVCFTAVLPVEMLSFTVELIENLPVGKEGDQVLCKWTTTAEINNDFFIVERSKNLQEWEYVGTVKGAGNTTQQTDYSLLDEQPYSGTSYYRLKQVDFNSDYEYFGPVPVHIDGVEIITIYPTPAGDHISYSLISSVEGNFTLTVLDILGRKVIQTTEMIHRGENKFPLSLNSIAEGYYLLRLEEINGNTRTQKQFVVR